MLGLGTLSRVARELREDLGAARQRDPAARRVRSFEVLFTYPGVHALLAHRLAHGLFELKVAYLSRAVTGVEIHPAASIGRALLIDHGGGVVIGETARIGDQVTLYQGVTLGGTGFARGKRHPTVEDEVVIGSGAKLLGPIHVGRASKVGANSVVIHDVPAHSTVVGNPGRPVRVGGSRPEGPDADWAHLPDPVADAIRSLAVRVADLEGALEEATGRKVEPGGQVTPLRRAGGSDPAAG
jgi:serine O-acetyltransferase